MMYIVAAFLLGFVLGLSMSLGILKSILINAGLIVLWIILFWLFLPVCLLTIPLVFIGLVLDVFQAIGAWTFDIKFSISENFMKLPGRVSAGLDFIGRQIGSQ